MNASTRLETRVISALNRITFNNCSRHGRCAIELVSNLLSGNLSDPRFDHMRFSLTEFSIKALTSNAQIECSYKNW